MDTIRATNPHTGKSMTYLLNLIDAIKGIPTAKEHQLTTEIHYGRKEHKKLLQSHTNLRAAHDSLKNLLTQPPKEVILKDPHGLIQADLVKLERFLDTKPYKVGDTIDEVAYKAGQQAVLRVIKEKLIAPATGRLT